MPQPPALTAEQRSVAFQRSLELRRERASVKWKIANGAPGELRYQIENCEAAQGMKVLDLLMALPGVGRARALKMLQAAGIPEKNTVRACGPRQTEALLSQLNK